MTGVRSLIVAFALFAALSAAPACYTLLKHPAVETSGYEETRTTECTSCHDEEEIWYYHHASVHRLYPGSVAGGWGFYYSVPWWYDSYWRYNPSSDRRTDPTPTRSLRPSEEKDPSRGAIGGPIGYPPPPKATGSAVRFKSSQGDSTGDADDAGARKSGDDETKKRDVRPKSAKEKPKGKEDKSL